jgi:hypothetical protein
MTLPTPGQQLGLVILLLVFAAYVFWFVAR